MEKPRAYLVRMSIKNGDIQVDEDEIIKVINSLKSGQPALVRRGLFNPSFFVTIVEDVDRLKSYYEELNRIKAQNDQNKNYNLNGGEQRKLPEFTKLSDIFDGVKLKDDIKKLN